MAQQKKAGTTRRQQAQEIVEAQDIPPVIDLDEEIDEDSDEVEGIELFKWQGRMFYMVKPKASASLRMLRILKEEGREMAMATMLMELLGEETYRALEEAGDHMSDKQMERLLERIVYFSTGNVEVVLGNL